MTAHGLKNWFANKPLVLRHILAVTGGFALTLAFPNWNLAGAAWAGPALMLFSAIGVKSGLAFRLGFIAGLVHALTSLSWLLSIPYTFHGMPLGPGLGWLALSAYVALYHGLWVWGCWKLMPHASTPAESEWDESRKTPSMFGPFLRLQWRQRMRWAIGCAMLWVGLEIVRGCFLSGFPWNMLGASQFRILPLIQIASIGGVYLVSFLIVWMSVSIGMALLGILREFNRKTYNPLPGLRGGNLMADIFLPMLVVAVVVSFGSNRLFSKRETRRELTVASVQPSIPQTVIWSSDTDTARFQKVLTISSNALASTPDLLVWPESAFPGFGKDHYVTLTNMITRHRVWTLLCADDVDPARSPKESPRYYNASFLFGPDGGFAGCYRKRRLVIFGEYVPLTRWLPFLKWFTPVDDGFTPGETAETFRLINPDAQFSVLICFEDVFPQEARDHVRDDTDFLVNLTNDGWFGEGACQWQQAAASVFRAVENGVPLLRCTNNGITCWIDALGRIRQISNPENVHAAGFMISKIPLPAPGAQPRTFYNLHGDWFGWGCAILTGFGLGFVLWKERRQKPATPTTTAV